MTPKKIFDAVIAAGKTSLEATMAASAVAKSIHDGPAVDPPPPVLGITSIFGAIHYNTYFMADDRALVFIDIPSIIAINPDDTIDRATNPQITDMLQNMCMTTFQCISIINSSDDGMISSIKSSPSDKLVKGSVPMDAIRNMFYGCGRGGRCFKNANVRYFPIDMFNEISKRSTTNGGASFVEQYITSGGSSLPLDISDPDIANKIAGVMRSVGRYIIGDDSDLKIYSHDFAKSFVPGYNKDTDLIFINEYRNIECIKKIPWTGPNGAVWRHAADTLMTAMMLAHTPSTDHLDIIGLIKDFMLCWHLVALTVDIMRDPLDVFGKSCTATNQVIHIAENFGRIAPGDSVIKAILHILGEAPNATENVDADVRGYISF